MSQWSDERPPNLQTSDKRGVRTLVRTLAKAKFRLTDRHIDFRSLSDIDSMSILNLAR